MTKTIIIDAGHGGKDSGASGFGVLEKDWALEISKYQYSRLKAMGADVGMTRKSDITLSPTERIARIKNQYDVCLSNHWNAFDGKARGVETIHSIHARPIFATDLAKRLVEVTGLPLRRVFTRKIGAGVDYYFLHRLTGRTETVIMEYGFIDHELDHEYYQQEASFIRAAEAVIEVVCEKIGLKYISLNVDGAAKETHKENQKTELKSFLGRRLESKHDGQLRFYKTPSWKDDDVYGFLTKGQGFPRILDKISVGGGEQYKVENSKGQQFYITAHSNFVEVK